LRISAHEMFTCKLGVVSSDERKAVRWQWGLGLGSMDAATSASALQLFFRPFSVCCVRLAAEIAEPCAASALAGAGAQSSIPCRVSISAACAARIGALRRTWPRGPFWLDVQRHERDSFVKLCFDSFERKMHRRFLQKHIEIRMFNSNKM